MLVKQLNCKIICSQQEKKTLRFNDPFKPEFNLNTQFKTLKIFKTKHFQAVFLYFSALLGYALSEKIK